MSQETQAPKQRIKEPEAASYTGFSRAFLRLKRMQGQEGGPPYIKVGRAVVYDTSDLDRWLDSHRIGGE